MAKEKVLFELELTDNKLDLLNKDGQVREGLTAYLNADKLEANATWAKAYGLVLAYDGIASELVPVIEMCDKSPNYGKQMVDENGKPVFRRRFADNKTFYEFVGIKESDATQKIKAVTLDKALKIDGLSLREYGFSIGKVYLLASKFKGENISGQVSDFLEYALRVCNKTTLYEIARITDKALNNLYKEYAEPTPTQTAEPAQTAEPIDTVTLDLDNIKREDILSLSLVYTGLEKSNVNNFVKWLKAEMLTACDNVK